MTYASILCGFISLPDEIVAFLIPFPVPNVPKFILFPSPMLFVIKQ